MVSLLAHETLSLIRLLQHYQFHLIPLLRVVMLVISRKGLTIYKDLLLSIVLCLFFITWIGI